MTLNEYALECHVANKRWWEDPTTGTPITRNFGELIALAHSELSEALEGHRKDLMDDKLPHRPMVEVEIVDCLIRLFDLSHAYGLDLDGAYTDKMLYNSIRADHRPEERLKEGGKKY